MNTPSNNKERLEATIARLTQQIQELQHALARSSRRSDETYLHLLQAEKLSELGLMASTMVHDIMNPLTMIIGEAQLLSMLMEDDPETVKGLKIIEQAGKHIAQLVQSVRAYSRQSSGEWRPVSLHDVINESLFLIDKFLATSHITVTKRYWPEDMVVSGNANQLEQVFLNLFQNAAQAMPGGGTLTIGTCLISDKVEVVVSDTGYGISEEHLDCIFDAFFTTKPPGQGTGLGLAICKRIVEDHQGTIVAESEGSGQGTRMIVTLPLAQ